MLHSETFLSFTYLFLFVSCVCVFVSFYDVDNTGHVTLVNDASNTSRAGDDIARLSVVFASAAPAKSFFLMLDQECWFSLRRRHTHMTGFFSF